MSEAAVDYDREWSSPLLSKPERHLRVVPFDDEPDADVVNPAVDEPPTPKLPYDFSYYHPLEHGRLGPREDEDPIETALRVREALVTAMRYMEIRASRS